MFCEESPGVRVGDRNDAVAGLNRQRDRPAMGCPTVRPAARRWRSTYACGWQPRAQRIGRTRDHRFGRRGGCRARHPVTPRADETSPSSRSRARAGSSASRISLGPVAVDEPERGAAAISASSVGGASASTPRGSRCFRFASGGVSSDSASSFARRFASSAVPAPSPKKLGALLLLVHPRRSFSLPAAPLRRFQQPRSSPARRSRASPPPAATRVGPLLVWGDA